MKLLLTLTSLVIALAAQQGAPSADVFADVPLRNIGPAMTGTRIVDLAVVERDPRVIYAATASSGVWKTANAGVTWTPLFDREAAISIGGIAVSASNPDVVWVATGEPNVRNLRSTTWGNGVYKSIDGGRTWRHMGLAGSAHTGRIAIHPGNPDVVLASVSGPLWRDSAAGDASRGLWKTSNGGSTWKKVIDAGPATGVVEVAIDPTRPNIVYAASWQRERRDFSFLGGGPGSAIWKSTDGGDTWTKLAAGLPAGPVGRIGISVCRSRPDTVFAVIDGFGGTEGGVYRTTDAGATWIRRNPVAASSNYYGQVRCDPTDPERVTFLQTEFSVSTDGGATFKQEPMRNVHVDHHALWIDPAQPAHIVLGNDGGLYQSWDRGATWRFHPQIPGTQFYSVAVDHRQPYFVYGGAQDNNNIAGPSATRATDGIVNDDWYQTTGGDGLSVQVEPGDPSVVYAESQYGALVRFNPMTGERRRIVPTAPAGTTYRWNWNAPIRIAPTDGRTLYFGAQCVFKSTDRGATWTTISPDLTKAIVIDPKYRMSDFGTLRWIDASPRKAGWLAAGSDDGLIHVSENDGGAWRKAAPLPGVPDTAQILRVMFSHHDDRTLFAVASNHENDDRRPFVFASRDLGATWRSVLGNLPTSSPVMAFVEDPVNPRLWFVGTQTGLFVTIDAGATWQPFGRNVLPTVPVHDLLIHPRDKDLVVATHGRGMWILDSLAGLEALTPAVLSQPAAIFAPRAAEPAQRFGRGRDAQGASFFAAPNPPDGALIDVYVRDASATAPSLEIVDASGRLVRTLTVAAGRTGLQRVSWDLRAAPAAGGRPGGAGTLVPAGTYTARLTLGATTVTTTVTVNGAPTGR